MTRSLLPLATDRLIIRAFCTDDAAAFHGWRNDAAVARYTLWDYPYAKERAEAFCARMAAMTPFPEGEWYQLIMEEKATGRAVGDIGIGNAVTPDGVGTISIGYSLSQSAQGIGYMTEALSALLPVLAGALGATKFVADIDARNPASGRVLARLGFTAGPIHKKRSFVKGEWCDEIDYELDAMASPPINKN